MIKFALGVTVGYIFSDVIDLFVERARGTTVENTSKPEDIEISG